MTKNKGDNMRNVFTLPWQESSDILSEVNLVKSSIKGDSTAFTELMKIHKVSLYKIAFSYIKDEEKALDILQETTYKGLLNIKKLNNPKFFKTWITRILINIAIDTSKKEDKLAYIEDEEILIDNNSNNSISIEEKLDLYDAIDNLRSHYRMAIILKYFNAMTDEEISLAMNIPMNTVKSHLRRSKQELKKYLRESDFNE